MTWRQAGRRYVFIHAVVSICASFYGLEYLIGDWYNWIPSVFVIVGALVEFGLTAFVLTSPIVCIVMIFFLSGRSREWLYLGLCDAALFILNMVSVVVACV
jgi:hypothetical protein